MTSASIYILRRLKPFFWLFLACELLSRSVITVYQWNDLDIGSLAQAFAVGLFFDLAVFTYFAIPLSLYLLCLPARLHTQKIDRIISTTLFFAITYVMLFSVVGEYLFWDEFQTRYNFIAVDYLVYTKEVVGNIRESYPVGPILTFIAAISAGLSYVFLKQLRKRQVAAPQFLYRAGVFACVCTIAVLSFFSVDGRFATISPNRYINEIARNGIFELFSAFRNNELDYKQFYSQLPDDKLVATLQKELGIKNVDTHSSPLKKAIRAKKPDQDYNLIVVTVESLSADFMNTFGSTRNITPHLDALAQNSLFFSNLYATGTRTVYGLSALTLAMPPIPGNAIVRRADNGDLHTIGSVLRDDGYATKFIYGGFGYFDNMNEFFSANGYDIVDRANLSDDEITFANVWGVCDEDLFARVLKEADNDFAAKKPFFNMVMTTSNHRPYTFPAGRPGIPEKNGGREAGVKYSDYAIHDFLQKAAKKPWFDHTIIVVVADHTAGSSGQIELDPAKYHIPLFIYAPKIIKPQVVDKLASQIDIVPTLLGLMNKSYESHFYGKDLMRENPDRAFVSSYQKLGYMTKDGLVILKPNQEIDFYTQTGKTFEKAASPAPQSMVDKAIAYFQGASNWRSWSKKPQKQ